MLRLAQPPLSHEDAFLERYDQLLTAALSLTMGDRETARDLVHDAYLHFVLARPPLPSIERIDGYLFTTIRNLHISHVRRRARVRHESLRVLDFDSAALGWRVMSVAQRLEAAGELCWICEYALQRREEARAASAFLLHYFLRYRPSEIAAVLKSPPAVVYKLLHVARADVRRALETRQREGAGCSGAAQSTDVANLRSRILAVPVGPCPSRSHLHALYRSTVPIDVTTLAHIVGCRVCLDRVNVMLGLPRLAHRDHDVDDPPNDRPSGGTQQTRVRRAGDRVPDSGDAAATHEHRPKELRMAVNGLPIGMQRVAGRDNEQVMRLAAHEPVTFIEVFSEQDVRLLLLNAEPLAAGAARQATSVQLSEGRLLEVALDLSDLCPTVHVTYRDPLFTEIEQAAESEHDEEAVARDAAVTRVAEARDETPGVNAPSSMARLLDAWRRGTLVMRARPQRRRFVQLAGVLLLVWLLFFTPGSTVSAAELAYRALVHLAGETWRWLSRPPMLPPVEAPSIGEKGRAVPLRAPALAPPPPVPPSWGIIDRSRAELLALTRLQRVESYLGQEVRFGIGLHGRARVEATVSNAQRRAEIAAVLASLERAQPLDVRIVTLEELAAGATEIRGSLSGSRAVDVPDVAAAPKGAAAAAGAPQNTSPPYSPAVRFFEVDRDRIGAAEILRRHFGNDEAVRDFAHDMLNRSRQASRHAWALQYLGDRFGSALVPRFPASERALLRDLIERHAREFDHEMDVIASALAPLFRGGVARGSTPSVEGGHFWGLATRLLELNRARDDALRRAFVASSGGEGSVSLSGAAFWDVMDASRHVAQQLQKQPDLFRR